MYEYKKMNNIGFYLERSFEYNDNGRYQNLEQAKEIDRKYKKLLENNNLEYHNVRMPYNIESMINLIDEKLKHMELA